MKYYECQVNEIIFINNFGYVAFSENKEPEREEFNSWGLQALHRKK